MAYEVPVAYDGQHAANGDLSARQFLFVVENSSGTLDLATDASNAMGVLQNAPIAGRPASVMTHGVTKVRAGGTINPGDPVKSGTVSSVGGYAVAQGGSGTILGRMVDTSAASSGKLCSVQLITN